MERLLHTVFHLKLTHEITKQVSVNERPSCHPTSFLLHYNVFIATKNAQECKHLEKAPPWMRKRTGRVVHRQYVDVIDQDGRRSVHLCEGLESTLDKVFLSVPSERVPGQLGVQRAASSLQITGVSDRTAVLWVGAADRLSEETLHQLD